MVRRVLVALLVAVLVTAAVVSLDFWRSGTTTDARNVTLLVAGSDDPGPEFRQQVVRECPDCTVAVEQAGGSADRQVQQLADALSAEVDVVVLEAVDPDATASLVPTAGTTRVVALGHAVPGATAYVGPDDDAIAGDLVRAVVEEVGKKVRVLLVEPPARYGARLDAATDSGLDPVGRVPAPTGDDVATATAAALRDELDTTPAARQPDAILTLDGDQAGVVDAVLAQRRIAIARRPLLAGEGHDLASLRRLVLGTQRWVSWTYPQQALDRAGSLAGRLATGGAAPAEELDGVPAELVPPSLVTVETLTDTLVRSGEVTLDELCGGETRQRCTALGLR